MQPFHTKRVILHTGETFVSEEYDCLVHRLVVENGKFSCAVSMERGQDASSSVVDENTILLSGQIICQKHKLYGDGFEGMRFGARIHVESDGAVSYGKKESA